MNRNLYRFNALHKPFQAGRGFPYASYCTENESTPTCSFCGIPSTWRPPCTNCGVEGYALQDEDVARLSPLLHKHINMLGRQSFPGTEVVAKGELRPLRDPSDGTPELLAN